MSKCSCRCKSCKNDLTYDMKETASFWMGECKKAEAKLSELAGLLLAKEGAEDRMELTLQNEACGNAIVELERQLQEAEAQRSELAGLLLVTRRDLEAKEEDYASQVSWYDAELQKAKSNYAKVQEANERLARWKHDAEETMAKRVLSSQQFWIKEAHKAERKLRSAEARAEALEADADWERRRAEFFKAAFLRGEGKRGEEGA